jgi:hypothetical protein
MSMDVIFESETEIGRCEPSRLSGLLEPSGTWVIWGMTTANQLGAGHMLRIEQRCYLRSSEQPDDVRSQEVVRPELLLEPAPGTTQESRKFVEQLHRTFVARAREMLSKQAWLAETPACASA